MLALRDDNLSDNELIISEHIIGNLDDDGYFKIEPIFLLPTLTLEIL